MPTHVLTGTDSFSGGARNDTYVIDPNAIDSVHISDAGGARDVLVVYDRPGRTAGEFLVAGDELIWRNFEGDEVRIHLNADGTSPIEFFEWQRLPEDGNPYTQRNSILLAGEAITGTNVSVALTAGADVLTAPSFGTFQDGWIEVYGNAGADTLTGSDTSNNELYGGRGNDLLRGSGNAYDDMTGDAGNDVLRGAGGDDYLDGGTQDDILNGGNGRDWLKGGAGDDTLTGGRGADQFFFESGETGHDTITDYRAGVDSIVLNNFNPFSVVQTQQGADVLITLDALSTVLVQNALIGQLLLQFE